MADTLVKISYIAFTGAAGCLILAIILFIKFKIPTVIGDLSGKNARKAIQQMRNSNETTMLASEETTMLNDVTESLENETEILMGRKKVKLTMLDDIMLVHTDEVIS